MNTLLNPECGPIYIGCFQNIFEKVLHTLPLILGLSIYYSKNFVAQTLKKVFDPYENDFAPKHEIYENISYLSPC